MLIDDQKGMHALGGKKVGSGQDAGLEMVGEKRESVKRMATAVTYSGSAWEGES